MNHLSYKNHYIKKKLGQHFLNNQNLINHIINVINPKKNQNIIEIGPGLGALTQPIANLTKFLTVIEIDKNLTKKLKENTAINKYLNIIQQDVMQINFNKLSKKLNKPLRILGNIPYNISTPLLFHILKYKNIINDIHFMLQKEIADRLIASPNNKNYGQLSIIIQYYCKIHHILEVPPKFFTPKPKVYSSFVQLIPYHYNNKPFLVMDFKKLKEIISLAFNQRRKMIRNSLSSILKSHQIISQGINDTFRAENLSIKEYCKLANFLTKNNKNKK